MSWLSGYCGQLGVPACGQCRGDGCGCPCHVGETAQIRRVNVDGFAGGQCDNRDAPAGCVNTAARADRTPFTRTGGRLMPIIVDPSADSQVPDAAGARP